MKIKCEYCSNYIDDTELTCPFCGAPNDQSSRTGNGAPTTIEELKAWYQAHNLPSEEVTRFFIGKDIKEKRAFGIYQDPNTGHFVVYKNKDDGTRAVRYEGTDEKYAVNEIYQKLRSEISNQKERNRANRAAGSSGSSSNRNNNNWHPSRKLIITIVVVFIALDILGFVINKFIPDTSYYRYGGNDYYYDTEWYTYDATLNDWTQTESVPSELSDNYQDYEIDSSSLGDGVSQFESAGDSGSTYDDDDWDSSSSWDSSDSWDSGSTDWGSDW